MISDSLIWLIVLASIACILLRPGGGSEAVWAVLGATLLLMTQLLPLASAAQAVLSGMDVYLFLAGMLFLAEVARDQGIFDWLASLAIQGARGSSVRLFTLVYGVGILVTTFLSNDATAVVLTGALVVALKKIPIAPQPHLFACALIANAASFVLPISNPANLLLYPHQLPPLLIWGRLYVLPSLGATTVTYLCLRWLFRKELAGSYERGLPHLGLSAQGWRVFFCLISATLFLLTASALSWRLGWPTLLAATVTCGLVSLWDRGLLYRIVPRISWSILLLVAGLFVLVAGLQQTGLLAWAEKGLVFLAHLPSPLDRISTAFTVGVLSNLMNNLPVALIGGVAASGHSGTVAVLIGTDLGPNLSVNGSLATILWLIVLRKGGFEIRPWDFFKVGLVTMPLSLLASILLSF